MTTESIHNQSSEETTANQNAENTGQEKASFKAKRPINWRCVGRYAAAFTVGFTVTAGAIYGARALKDRSGSTTTPSAE